MDHSDIPQTERIEQYMTNRLDSAERRAFEEDLIHDGLLRQHYEEAQLTRAAAQQYALRQEIGEIRRAMRTEKLSSPVVDADAHAPVGERSGNVRILAYAGRIAAGIALLLVGFIGFQYATLSGEALYDERSGAYSLTANRSAEVSQDTAEERLKQLYRSASFSEVISTYEELPAPSLEATFLAGNAYLQQSQGALAAQAFRQVVAAGTPRQVNRFEEDAQYYLALSHLQENEIDQALPILEAINNNPHHSYHALVTNYYLWKVRFLSYIG